MRPRLLRAALGGAGGQRALRVSGVRLIRQRRSAVAMDDRAVVHEVLGLESGAFRDLYHFTVGGALEDTRLTTLPAYPDAVHARSG
jgi:hypothetical protein